VQSYTKFLTLQNDFLENQPLISRKQQKMGVVVSMFCTKSGKVRIVFAALQKKVSLGLADLERINVYL